MPAVEVECSKCKERIIVYDLKYYPAATIISGSEKFEEFISIKDDVLFNVFVIYEYSELDENQEFNPDDISWCEIYGYGLKSKQIFTISNDETA